MAQHAEATGGSREANAEGLLTELQALPASHVYTHVYTRVYIHVYARVYAHVYAPSYARLHTRVRCMHM